MTSNKVEFYCVNCGGPCRADHAALGWNGRADCLSRFFVLFPCDVMILGMVARVSDEQSFLLTRMTAGNTHLLATSNPVPLPVVRKWPPGFPVDGVRLPNIIVNRGNLFSIEGRGVLLDWGFFLRRSSGD